MFTGCLRDKEDVRDYIYQPCGAVKYPDSYELERVDIKNQGNVASCVAHSIATIKEIQEYYETKQKLKFSVGWIYGYRVGTQYKGEGMYPKEALNNLVKYGDVIASLFPENATYPTVSALAKKRELNCLVKAKPYRCKAYARVKSVADVKSCIYTNKSPVLLSVELTDTFYKTAKDGIVKAKGKISDGYHAMVIVGWKQIKGYDYWIVQNSWGASFGDGGYCYINTKSNVIADMYTVTDLRNVKR